MKPLGFISLINTRGTNTESQRTTSKNLQNHHHHKHQELDHLARSFSTVTAALTNVSSVSQLFSFPVDCSDMILKGIRLCGILCRCNV
jgi:hypothetical protein